VFGTLCGFAGGPRPDLADSLATVTVTGRMLSTILAVARIDAAGHVAPDQIEDLLACLYGLHAILQLHYVQEEENYFALARDWPSPGR
jgi:hypothetical protein